MDVYGFADVYRQLPLGIIRHKALPLRAAISNYHESNDVMMKRLRLAIQSYLGLLLAVAVE